MESLRPGSEPSVARSSSPALRQYLRRASPATNDDSNRSTIHYVPAQTSDDIERSSVRSSVGKQQTHIGYEKFDAPSTDGGRAAQPPHVLWTGLPVYALTWEILGIIISILFLILGAFVAKLKDQNETEWSRTVIQATRVAPSIWPILFSGVLGNAVRRFANWRVEHGIQLLALEQLMGSLTMAGSLIAIFTWWILKPASLVLILLWAFNPLGSQASFRAVYLSDVTDVGTGTISHYDPRLSLQMNLTAWSYRTTRLRPTIRAQYEALLYDVIASTQYADPQSPTYDSIITKLGGARVAGVQSAMDIWGNIRIPHLEYMAGYNPSDPAEWVSVPWTEAVQNYSSLAGDRFEGVDRAVTGNTTFNMSSSYQTFNCAPWIRLNGSQARSWISTTFGYNGTVLWSGIAAVNRGHTNRLLPRTYFAASSAGKVYNRTYPGSPQLIFGNRIASEEGLNYTSCDSRTTYVDTQVECRSQGTGAKLTCGVKAIRKMPTAPESDTYNLLETWRVREGTGTNIVPLMPHSFLDDFMDLLDDNNGGSGASSLVEYYIQDPLTAFGAGPYSKEESAELWDVDVKLVEKRLSLLYNTLWKLGWTYKSIHGGDWVRDDKIDNIANVTADTLTPLQPVYAIDMPWMIIYFVSVGIMLLAALSSLALHALCIAPPMLGYVSSLVRDSVFFSEPGIQGNSTEGGSSKARRLGQMKVKIADVWSGESVGRVAFAPAEGKGAMQKGKWYE